jgi:hypothetical protein
MDPQTTNPLTEGGAEAISLSQAIGSLLNPEPAKESTPAPAAPQERPRQAQPQAPQAEPAAEEAQPEAEAEPEEEEPPPLEAPAHWKKAAKELFSSLPRELQSAAIEREREREQGLSRAMQDVAEKRKGAESERTAVETERQKLKTALEQLVPDLQLALHGKWAGVDWNKLSSDNPAEYVALRQQFESDVAKFNAARQQRAKIAEQEKAEADKARQETARKEWTALTDKRPELNDQAKAKAFFDDIHAYALSVGYTQERFAQIENHLDFLALEKAMKFDKAETAKAAALVKTVPKVQTPGTAKTKADRVADERSARLKKLEQTGDIEDARGLLRI